MRNLILVLLLGLAVRCQAVNFVKSVQPSADTYLAGGDPGTSYSTDPSVLWAANDLYNHAPMMRFVLPSLAAGESFDSAHVVVVPVTSPLQSSTCRVYEVIRGGVNVNLATWNTYDGSQAWGTAGAWGAADIDLSTNYGYGANGIIYQFNNHIGVQDSTFVARGTGFNDFVSGNLGTAVILIWHDQNLNESGSWSGKSLQDSPTPYLRIFGRRVTPTSGGAARRREMHL